MAQERRWEDGEEYMATILNDVRLMRLIRQHRKTCEIKSTRRILPARCKYLIFRGSKGKVRSRGCRHFLVARLLSTTPLGPFQTGAEVLAASTVRGQEFRTGMDAAELDRFIRSKTSKQVWVHRFEGARACGEDVIEWNDAPGNSNCGFLPHVNARRGIVRFRVLRPAEEGEAVAPERLRDGA